MKDALDKEGLHPFLMCQPLGYRDPDAGHFGWINLPEFPYAIEPRQITRIEAMKYARGAYDLGIRYIGGCCGFEPYHIRANLNFLEICLCSKRELRAIQQTICTKTKWN